MIEYYDQKTVYAPIDRIRIVIALGQQLVKLLWTRFALLLLFLIHQYLNYFLFLIWLYFHFKQ